jgi:predicted enzyme related to lactoylglutathione lyase
VAGIARLWKPVVNVTDLAEGERFWSALAGLTPQGRQGDAYSILEPDDPDDVRWILLQLVPHEQRPAHSGTHLDLQVDDVADAVGQVEGIGGVVVRRPEIYREDGQDVLEWAVMQDPFGNEFCLVRYPLD